MNYTTVQITEERREQITKVQAEMSGRLGVIVPVREVIDLLIETGLRHLPGESMEPTQ